MKLPYQNELYELRKWIDNVRSNLPLQLQFQRPAQEVNSVCKWISVICANIQGEYPFYASLLPQISNLLFTVNNMGMGYLNPAAFGELIVVIRHIEAEPVPTPFWKTVHKRIVYISASLYEDGHYGSAAEKAVKEVEVRLREKFAELKQNAFVPKEITEVISALFSDNGVFHFCDTSTISGKNYHRGVRLLFEGTMAAYRNPSSHANLETEKREALEQIMLASQLMYVLDLPPIQ